MRKLTVLLVVALAATSTGCCGKMRSWFHKGSPCGTVMAPAMMSAPMAMSTPVMSGPMMTGDACCVPCQPCCDPCGQGMSSGYFGGYMDGGSNCGCGATSSGTTFSDGATLQTSPATITPAPYPAQ